MAQNKITWSQMSGLPDEILDNDSEVEEVTWQELFVKWNPKIERFVASAHWKRALIELGVGEDDVHMGLESGCLRPPFSDFNLGMIQECTKAPVLVVQVISQLKDRQLKVRDMVSEAYCSVHPKVSSQYALSEGSVIVLQNITVLPEKVLNITLINLVKVFS